MPGDDDNTLERDVDDGVVPYCSDGWHSSGKYYGQYYVYKSHKVVNGMFSWWTMNGIFSLLVINGLFSLLAVNCVFSILSLVSNISLCNVSIVILYTCSQIYYLSLHL